MKAFYSYLLAVSALSLYGVASTHAVPVQGTKPAIHVGAPPPAAKVLHWRTFTSSAGRFSVLLPAAPEVKTVVLSPVKETLQQFICRTYTGFYLIQYVDRPAKEVEVLGAEKILALTDDAFAKSNHGSSISRRHFLLNGHPGHQITATRTSGSRETQCVYLVGTRHYTLVTLQRRDQVEADPTASAKFLDSFTLLAAKTLPRNR